MIMKIFSITNNSPISNKYNKLHTNPSPTFQGRQVSPKISKRATETLGDLAKPFLENIKAANNNKGRIHIDEQNALEGFIRLQKRDINVANLLLKSDRRFTDFLIERVFYEKKLNKKELKAFEYLLNSRGGVGCNVFLIPTLYLDGYFNNAKSEDIDAIIYSTPKIVNIYKNNPQLEQPMPIEDFIAMAHLLKESETFTEDELKQYINSGLSTTDECLYAWEKGDIEYRKKILDELKTQTPLLEENLATYYYDGEIVLHPDENLLNKIKLLSTEPELKNVTGVLKNTSFYEDLQDNLEKYKQLPEETKEKIEDKLIKTYIINFNCFKIDGFIKHADLTVDDYIKLVKNIPLEENIINSRELLSIPPITEDIENKLEGNSKILKDLSALKNNPVNTILKLLFSDKLENDKDLLAELINTDRSDIIQEVKYKCENFNPEFVNSVIDFFDFKTNIYKMATLPGFNKKEIIETFYHIAKLQALAMNKPENFMNYREYEIPKNAMQDLKEISKAVLFDKEEYLSKEDSIPSELAEPFLALLRLFSDESLMALYSAITNTDAEYVNMLFSRRVENAESNIEQMADLDYTTGNIISNLLKHGKNLDSKNIPIKLSGKQKTFLVKNVPHMQFALKTKFNDLLERHQQPLKNRDFILNYESLLEEYSQTIFQELGLNPNSKNIQLWDKTFIHQILTPHSGDNGELKLIFNLLSNGDLENYIHNPFTPHGSSNQKTKEEFKKLNIDYPTWLKGIPSQTFKFGSKVYSIGIIDRNEPNNLFLGNYTSCCTALDGTYGASMPNYLLNTTFNIIGIKDKDGKPSGMIRIFITNDNNKPALIIDNTELNNHLQNFRKEELEKVILKYVKDFTKALSPNQNIPVYISAEVFKISPKGTSVPKFVKPIGEITKKYLYINCIHEMSETNIPHCVPLNLLDI